MSRIYDFATNFVRRIYERRIRAPAILEAETQFPNAAKFVGAWKDIRDEALAVRLTKVPRFHDIMPEQAEISANDGLDWRMFVLKAYDMTIPENLSRMPVLSRLLNESPEVKSAAISFLAPHKHIPAHRGPFRGVMRFHLGLVIPRQPDGRPATIMMINHQERRIADGECMLWDDTFEHEVMNKSDQPRVALLLDVWRPNMPVDMEMLSRLIVRVVQIGMRYRGVSFAG
ncbi:MULTISPECIES: aspartyl/asparaginyl beta-hydroxylase domain-containing protein [unclassified Mesorhizobium]|uniref:aspartyl/asparaginyl beta-hydroxylase domain-containing protein n=1 Tax=unclassified Mesorhizobium TaxID=325217 RepID=UPI000FD93DE9|nr:MULTISPECIES: aspartyl/asparaginyl beta-hydroxylase domain-containing protein [unclassified Mesorhizobium]TGQ04840.1 aspartyl/asparaginyl beta-hydroxylase domain-containing protein [Mesorhizobium sp. M2E.F.Ca.ET.219.01.1.1]TGS14403.1 aspartyl/asparaginyl beta-hydroxylase domain-containing protein [Mesorhizobium sp. M2E.F.Ca.ET.209.01.1.1]TGT65450.1 aspartyl/asparaginyl beta-hydroxylase domain-containing protein [Mesorhizobium sp. M2E.F.Ca.ET.166.01.1.1]TGV97496.1 aspartyl/asparaginyl beta-hy